MGERVYPEGVDQGEFARWMALAPLREVAG
ncbi:hypothetical protein TNMX_12850 [Thermus sp. NMX2.A1]|nr:hypothetical protein TNMX_12850 [Thermus sp. NMX2.A1]